MNPVLRQAVAEAHAQLERRTTTYLAERRIRVSCGYGCHACCSAWVVVGLAEAMYLREALEARRARASDELPGNSPSDETASSSLEARRVRAHDELAENSLSDEMASSSLEARRARASDELPGNSPSDETASSSLEVLARIEAEAPKRLARIARQKHRPDFPTRYFLENHPCPLLTPEGACAAHPYRPLACRGLLTDLPARYCAPGEAAYAARQGRYSGVVPALRGHEKTAYVAQLKPWHGPEHYLKAPWRIAERTTQKLWAKERQVRGFTVIGELVGLVFLLGQRDFQEALQGGLEAVEQFLEKRRLLGGEYGYWVG